METSLSAPDSLTDGYSSVYLSLTALRETFHRSGRLDDSNAKLDEIAKLFATYLAYKRGLIAEFPAPSSSVLVSELQSAFETAARLPQYQWKKSGRSIFGEHPKLALRADDQSLAHELTLLIRQCVDLAYQAKENGDPFDILNETFGHFVRDNFRGNVEDAQYMTPPEVVDFVVDMALNDIQSDSQSRYLTVLDPSCGVGSFLTTFYFRSKARCLDLEKIRLIGQDKVERMARLATINLELFDVNEHRIEIGNSLVRGSALDELNDGVDLILTNPPFGARFSSEEVRTDCGENTPFFSSLTKVGLSIDSELLFIDRNLKLLRDGGRLLIVIPDGVVSAKGTAAILRQHLAKTATLKAIIELPAVTFAQAGTRTKTSVLYIQKGRSQASSHVFMAKATDLGFQVSSRKGIQIKQRKGINQLPQILDAYSAAQSKQLTSSQVLNRDPSCVSVEESEVLRSSWTPSHYSAQRLEAIASVQSAKDLDMVALHELVDFCGEARRNERWMPGMAYVSVLHVLGEGLVDTAGAQTYAPITPGVPTQPGEILVARINPRIPRVCMTPDFEKKTLCSSEFEVLAAKPGIDSYLIAYLLLSELVQSQIRSLTSGTSASHNRIRTSELANVMIPLPRPGSVRASQLEKLASEYRSTLEAMSRASVKLAFLRGSESQFLGTSLFSEPAS